ncbi:MAG: beta-lactamase family protein [Alphaproteobacteria bacterium]|nr:beta-lactamase family protein [Alphaproteobacteria bacterium]
MSSDFPLPAESPSELGFLSKPLADLDRLIRRHIEEGRYPGCQIALARNGKLALFRTYGDAKREPQRVAADDDTLFLLFSNTKVLTMAAVWSLVEEGALSFIDRVSDHLPEFTAHGKEDITIFQVATHQAGFPSANCTRAAWADHARMRAEVCAFQPEWPAGTRLHYHGRAAHLTLAMVIEAVTGRDYREVIRERVIAPLGIAGELFVGVPRSEQGRCADVYAPPGPDAPGDNSAEFREAGLPHGGGFGTARAMAAFYQMMLNGGRLGAVRLFSKRMIDYVTRDFTGEMPDGGMALIPMHRGLGPHVRGTGGRVRGLGSIAPPATFGHGGVGSSYCWADPTSGVSFAYITNFVQPDPWHSQRLDRIANLVHAAIE